MIDLSLLRIKDGVLQRIDKRRREPIWRDCSNAPHKDGYVRITVSGKALLKHRVVFAVSNGYEANTVDHIDGDKLNNHPSNLRDLTQWEQAYNRRISSANTSGWNGVSFHKASGKWVAQGDRKNKYLGLASCPTTAMLIVKQHQLQQGGYSERHGK